VADTYRASITPILSATIFSPGFVNHASAIAVKIDIDIGLVRQHRVADGGAAISC
jgi:hypothetical protein